MNEWQLWEEIFRVCKAIYEDGLTGQSSDATDFLAMRHEELEENLVALGYTHEAIEEYGDAWLQFTPLWHIEDSPG